MRHSTVRFVSEPSDEPQPPPNAAGAAAVAGAAADAADADGDAAPADAASPVPDVDGVPNANPLTMTTHDRQQDTPRVKKDTAALDGSNEADEDPLKGATVAQSVYYSINVPDDALRATPVDGGAEEGDASPNGRDITAPATPAPETEDDIEHVGQLGRLAKSEATPQWDALQEPGQPPEVSNMYRQQAAFYADLHRRRVERQQRVEDGMESSDDEEFVWGQSNTTATDGGVVGKGKRRAPKPGFVKGDARGKSFLPEYLLSKDTNAKKEGETMEQVLGRMAHQYNVWQEELASGAEAAKVVIPAWNQAAFKYVFHDAFEEKLDPAEIQALAALVGSVIVNMTVVCYNAANIPHFQWSSTRTAANVVFWSEFFFVVLSFLILLGTCIHAAVKNKITTGFAVDVVVMSRFVGEFSVLQIVRLISPMIVVTYVLPFVAEARTTREQVRGVFVVFCWLLGVFISGLCLVIKVSQVQFAHEAPFTAWTFTNYLVMVGLMLNLAKVDSSYDAVSEALLEAVHKHFIGPGHIVMSKADKSRSLFSKVMKKLIGVERDALFTMFGTVFNYHFGQDNDATDADLTVGERVRKMLNFMSFVAKLDNRYLERYLEMVESPMYHYQVGRRMFADALKAGDVSAMEMSIWLCDPLGDESFRMAEKYPEAFQVAFECSDE